MRFSISVLGMLASLALATRALGQASEITAYETRIPAPAVIQQGNFGSSVSISGDTLAVGMPGAHSLVANSGAVYLWQRVSGVWVAQPTLYAPDASSGAQFSLVCVQGDRLAVGAPLQLVQGVYAGAVYIYDRIGGVWTFQAKLQAPGPQVSRRFGISLSLDGSRVLVGAMGNPLPGTAYMFAESGGTWSLEAQLDSPNVHFDDDFGQRVALRGDSAFVSAPDEDLGTGNEGAVYAFGFTGSQWSLQSKLTASDSSADDRFGTDLEIDGGQLAVGASFAGDSPAWQPGAVYLFEDQSGTWVETEKLQPVGLTAFSGFGGSIRLSGDRLVIGAPRAGNYGGSGAAYFYQRMGGAWLLRQRIWPQGSEGSPDFGAVAFDGELLAIGAPLYGDNPSGQGSLYTFHFTSDFDALCFGDGSGAACPCSNTSKISIGMGCAHSGGKGGRLLAEGIASVAADTVRLRGSDMPPGFGLYLQAKATLNVGTGSPRMDGLMCIGGPLVRLRGETISPLGMSSYPGPVTDPPISVRGAVSPGDVRYYQVYFRDNATFCTSAAANYSNAVRIVWGP